MSEAQRDPGNPRLHLVDQMWRANISAFAGTVPMSEAKFDLLLEGVLERPVAQMSDQELVGRISVAQAAMDRLFVEIEQRDVLPCSGDDVLIPYNVPLSRHIDSALLRTRLGPTGSQR